MFQGRHPEPPDFQHNFKNNILLYRIVVQKHIQNNLSYGRYNSDGLPDTGSGSLQLTNYNYLTNS